MSDRADLEGENPQRKSPTPRCVLLALTGSITWLVALGGCSFVDFESRTHRQVIDERIFVESTSVSKFVDVREDHNGLLLRNFGKDACREVRSTNGTIVTEESVHTAHFVWFDYLLGVAALSGGGWLTYDYFKNNAKDNLELLGGGGLAALGFVAFVRAVRNTIDAVDNSYVTREPASRKVLREVPCPDSMKLDSIVIVRSPWGFQRNITIKPDDDGNSEILLDAATIERSDLRRITWPETQEWTVSRKQGASRLVARFSPYHLREVVETPEWEAVRQRTDAEQDEFLREWPRSKFATLVSQQREKRNLDYARASAGSSEDMRYFYETYHHTGDGRVEEIRLMAMRRFGPLDPKRFLSARESVAAMANAHFVPDLCEQRGDVAMVSFGITGTAILAAGLDRLAGGSSRKHEETDEEAHRRVEQSVFKLTGTKRIEWVRACEQRARWYLEPRPWPPFSKTVPAIPGTTNVGSGVALPEVDSSDADRVLRSIVQNAHRGAGVPLRYVCLVKCDYGGILNPKRYLFKTVKLTTSGSPYGQINPTLVCPPASAGSLRSEFGTKVEKCEITSP